MKRLLVVLKGLVVVVILTFSISSCFYDGGRYYRYGYAPARPYMSYSYRRPYYNYNPSYNYQRGRNYNHNQYYSNRNSGGRSQSYGSRNNSGSRSGGHR